jgi:hypothetical protein
MSLVNPSALLLVSLALPVIVFYILKIRLRRVPVSTLLFWGQIFEEKKHRSLWQRLRHVLSLLLQLAFLGLLVLALADPIFRWQQARARRVVLVVDNSASMNATDVEPSRLAAAKIQGRRVIEGMRAGDELALIAAGAQPRVACGPTDHERTLLSALDSVVACDGPTRIDEAVLMARRLLSGSDKVPRVVVISDFGFAAAADLMTQADIELIGVGRKTANLGITRLQARRSLLDPIGYEILVEVQNASDEPASFRLELDLNEEPIDVVPLSLAPGERTLQVFEKTSAEGGRLRATIDRPDSFPVDNTAWAILPHRSRQKVVLITAGNRFLEKVFEAIPLVDLEIVRVPREDAGPAGGTTDPGAAPAVPANATGSTVTVFHRKFPDVLPAGHVLVIEPDRSGPLWKLGELLHDPVVAKLDKESPLMLHVRLDNVVMPEARKLALAGPARVLAESAARDPLYAVVEQSLSEGQGKAVVLSVDLDKSDLPLQTAFPIMMANLLNWFGGTKGELTEAIPAGAAAPVEVPSARNGPVACFLRAPDGREQLLAAPEGLSRLTAGPLDRCGVWTIVGRRAQEGAPIAGAGIPSKQGSEQSVGSDEVVTELACNLADRRESDLRPAAELPERPASLAAGFAIRPTWYYLLASALMLTCWEWFLYHRRWID